MTIAEALAGFIVVAVVITVIPGLDTTLVLRSALVRSRGRAFMTGLGVCTGLLVWGVAAAIGAAALLAASELAYRIVSYAGIAYMLYLGIGMIVRSLRGGSGSQESPEAPPKRESPWRGFAVGASTNLLNPKIGVFYIATIPQFIPAHTSALWMGLLLAAVHAVLTIAWFALVILGAHAARRWLASPRAMRVVDGVAGAVIIGFAGRLALQQR